MHDATLTDEEFALGPEEWAKFEDPFNKWPASDFPKPEGPLPSGVIKKINMVVNSRQRRN